MKVYVNRKSFQREPRDIQKLILLAIDNLYERILLYEKQNVPFEQIFNDDRVKYDKHGKFYTFKSHKEHVQLRILYSYFKVNNCPVILVADYVLKKKNDTRYIKRFEAMNKEEPYIVYLDSICIADDELF